MLPASAGSQACTQGAACARDGAARFAAKRLQAVTCPLLGTDILRHEPRMTEPRTRPVATTKCLRHPHHRKRGGGTLQLLWHAHDSNRVHDPISPRRGRQQSADVAGRSEGLVPHVRLGGVRAAGAGGHRQRRLAGRPTIFYVSIIYCLGHLAGPRRDARVSHWPWPHRHRVGGIKPLRVGALGRPIPVQKTNTCSVG